MPLHTEFVTLRIRVGIPTFQKFVRSPESRSRKVIELLPKSLIKEFTRIRGVSNDRVKAVTLPYIYEGTRLVKGSYIPSITQDLQRAKASWDRYREQWAKQYPAWVDHYSKESGIPASDYPAPSDASGLFTYRFFFCPLPSIETVEGLDIGEEAVNAMALDIPGIHEEIVAKAKLSGANRVLDRVSAIVNTLSHSGRFIKISSKIFPALIDEVGTVRKVSPVIDGTMLALMDIIERDLDVPAETIRKNLVQRSQKLDVARDIETSIQNYINSIS